MNREEEEQLDNEPQSVKRGILDRRDSSIGKIGGVVIDAVQEKFQDQDFTQRLSMIFVVLLELYRVLVSSLLIVFVPQKCDDHLCSLTENLESRFVLYLTALSFNFLTLAVFGTMYAFEIWREHLLIEYLEVNPKTPNRNSFVEMALQSLSEKKKAKIFNIVRWYKRIGACAIVMYVVNAILSAVVISHYVLGNQTITSYVTNVLFMVQKFIDVYYTISSEPNVFLSAYLRAKVQFNDVDPEYRGRSMDIPVNTSSGPPV
jgi:hypothetical protein